MFRVSWKDRSSSRKHLGLDRNENFDFVLRDIYKDFFEYLTPEDIVLYPNIAEAYKTLGTFTDIDPDKLLLCNGSEQGLKILLESFKLQGYKSLKYWNPTFQMASVYGEIYSYDSNITQYRYSNDKFETTTDAKGNDVVYVVNPNNPTGTSISNETIEELCRSNNIVIVDEAYYEFNNYYTCASLVDKYNNLYILRTLSKAAGAAGARVGYIVTAPDNIKLISLTKPAYEVSGVGVKLIRFINDNPRIISDSVERLVQAKYQIENKYTCIPSIGNYVIMHYSTELWTSLSEVADVKLLTISSKKFIRLTVTNHKDIIE